LSEEKLAERFDIGIKIVRRALEELEQEGVILRKKRIGTFINRTNITSNRCIAIAYFDLSETTAYFGEIISGIKSEAARNDYSIQITPIITRKSMDFQQGLLFKQLREGIIDGLLLLSWLEKKDITAIMDNNVPVVVAGFEYRDLKIPTVLGDIRGTVGRALDELLKDGHRRIGIISGSIGISNPSIIMAQEKISEEYERILKSHGCYDHSLQKNGHFTEKDGYWLMNELLSLPEKPSAVITLGNELTNGAIQATRCNSDGKGPVIFPLADREAMLPRPLLKNPISKIGETAVRMMNEIISGQPLLQQKLYIEAELMR